MFALRQMNSTLQTFRRTAVQDRSVSNPDTTQAQVFAYHHLDTARSGANGALVGQTRMTRDLAD